MHKRSSKQQGFVSIITTSIIMIITTLVVIGFSQLMQRELRQSLDRQLSSQALYAAETGVNDLYDRLQRGLLTQEQNDTDCDVSTWPNGGLVNPNNNTNQAAYTCVLFDQTPNYIEFNNGAVTTQQSKIFPIQPKENNVQSLTFSWSGARGNREFSLPLSCSTINDLPPTSALLGPPVVSAGVPILRVDLVRMPTVGRVNINTLTETDTSTFFLYPKGSCGDTSSFYARHATTVDKGKIIEVDCSASTSGYACDYTIDQMQNVNGGSDRYFARIKSIYNDADVRIEGQMVGVSGLIEFVGAQVTADVTGKSNDVLRRIKVQLGNPSYPIPEFVMQGLSGVCKSINISPSNGLVAGLPATADTSGCP